MSTIYIEIYRNDRLRETWRFYLSSESVSLSSWSVEEKPKFAKIWKTIRSWSRHWNESPQTRQDEKPIITQEVIDLVHKKLCEIPIQ